MIRISHYRRGGWEVDIRIRRPNGDAVRERVKSPVSSHRATVTWAQGREQELLAGKPKVEASAPPTLKEFSKRFLKDYAEANRQKPSTIEAKRSVLEAHLIPLLGSLPLDQIGPAEAQELKTALKKRSPKTVNNALSVLHKLLSVAVEWDVIPGPAPRMALLHYERPERPFWEFADLEKLIQTAAATGWLDHLVFLLGSKAGLRCGEMLTLTWGDVDLRRQRLTIRASEWRGHTTTTKGRRLRRVPLAHELAAVLRDNRHLRSERVLAREDGSAPTQQTVRTIVARVERAAGLRSIGVHALRHTFCSHLAMRGVPAKAIQELAGHANLTTTMGYMHLSPAAIESAIQSLESSPRGDLGDTAKRDVVN